MSFQTQLSSRNLASPDRPNVVAARPAFSRSLSGIHISEPGGCELRRSGCTHLGDDGGHDVATIRAAGVPTGIVEPVPASGIATPPGWRRQSFGGNESTDRILVVSAYQARLLQPDERHPNQTLRRDDDASIAGAQAEGVSSWLVFFTERQPS